MADYQLTATAIILRTADSAFIPADPANRDYQAYLAWVAAGNTPDPVLPPSLVPIIAASTQALLIRQAKTAVAQGDHATAINLLLQLMETP